MKWTLALVLPAAVHCSNGWVRSLKAGYPAARPELKETRTMSNAWQYGDEINPALRAHVEQIHRSPSLDGAAFDPAALVRAVNDLWPLGMERALAALRAYHRLTRAHPSDPTLDEQRVLPIARLLFVRRDGAAEMPPLMVGGADIAPPPSTFPLFPLALSHGLPFLLITGYTLDGLPQSPEDHLAYCEQRCRLRDAPLSPDASPITAVNALIADPRWQSLYPLVKGEPPRRPPQASRFEYAAAMLHGQALRALSPIYAQSEAALQQLYPGVTGNAATEWQNHERAVELLSPRWDPPVQAYVATRAH